ncbi:MAG: 23S rRNA (adenine(2503)-C(2))-methyltransferase RlmN [Verrucomicrobiota bacterium]
MNSAQNNLQSATGLTLADWETFLKDLGQPKFRANQIAEWLYSKRANSFDAMTNLGKSLRHSLSNQFKISELEKVSVTGSSDTTQKYLFRLHDDRLIETVLIPATQALFGEKSDRRTLCVSSQVGCAFDCKFCASGLAGLTRNLSAAEIVSQVLQVERESGESVQNLVFMGMGEPLANLKNLKQALEILNSDWGVNIGARKMTISTSGVAPAIEKLAELPMQIRLAISLHGATDDVRSRIMPVNEKFNIDRLFQALDVWSAKKKQKITFEYILIDGVNDDLEQARVLAQRANRLRAKVNLIPYNTVEGLPWKRPETDHQEAFLNILTQAGVKATLRREKGHDIAAACGQLRLQEETAQGIIPKAEKVR